MTPLDFTTAKWANGPRLMAWLDRIGVKPILFVPRWSGKSTAGARELRPDSSTSPTSLRASASIRRRYRTTYGSRTTTVAEAAARGQRPAGGGVVGNGRIIRILLGLIGAREYGVHLREIIISVIVAVISDGIVKTRDGSARGCGVSTSQAAATRSWFHIAANGARNARDGKSGEHSASRPQTRGGGGGESGSFGLARQARGEVNLRRAPRVRTYEPSSWSPR